MTKIWNQSFLKINLFWRKKSNLIFSGILLTCFLILDSVALSLIKTSNNPNLLLINLFVTLQSLLIAVFVIFLTIRVFRGEINDNVHKTELRFGLKNSELFLSRLIMVLIILISAFLFILIVNFIFVFASAEFQSILGYRIFVSSLAWYAMVSFITFTITLLLSVFLSEVIAGIFAVIIFVGLITSSFIAPTIFKNKGMSQELKDTESFGWEIRTYEKYQALQIEASLEKFNQIEKTDLKLEKFQKFIQNIQIIPGSEEEWYNKKNILCLGPEWWAEKDINNDELVKKYPQIFKMMEDFDEYFNQPNHHWFDYGKINGLGNDVWLHQRIEPIPELLKLMKKDIKPKYQDLINTLLKLNVDVQALHSLHLDYRLDNEGHWDGQEKKLTEYIEGKEINPSKILFFKAFLQLLGGHQQTYFNGSNQDNEQFHDVIIIVDQAKEMTLNQRKNVMINPFLQISAMFQSINYQNYYLDNTLASTQIMFESTANFYVENNAVHRTLYPEGIYAGYFVLNCLLIYLAYFKFKINIVK